MQRISDEEERAIRQKDLEDRHYTEEWIVKELRRWHVLRAEFLGKEFLSVPPASERLTEVLKMLQIPLPAKTIHLRDIKADAK